MANTFTLALSISKLVLASELAARESDKALQRKKQDAVDDNLDIFRDVYPQLASNARTLHSVRALMPDLSVHEGVQVLIELAFINPFSPHDLKYDGDDFKRALNHVAGLLKQSPQVVREVLDVKAQAVKAHKNVNWWMPVAFVVGGLLLVTPVAWLAAPAIGAMVGSAMGLAGAAATSAGLAALGGGSLAVGGAGMAGGMWLVTGLGATAGAVMGAGANATTKMLVEMGAEAVRTEVIKAQVTFKVVTLGYERSLGKANESIEAMKLRRKDLRRERTTLEQDDIPDHKQSKEFKAIDDSITAFERGVDWMEDELDTFRRRK
ncbi:hypothetical protein [Deinococcus yavapaiensis]|uniref:Uncharacterized protein n=1 Tax=Deinococcus yavapaiensis KR-236 TaxID=694435 RepID=A0A318S8P0_9DEIO|nr:hypothetical protein [Deinococcus yavapaiensis]PYE52002.1 hypothetical protein DES52_11348 [Deinococcus yavapaiensis KR-236]